MPDPYANPDFEWRVKAFWAWASIAIGLSLGYIGIRSVILLSKPEDIILNRLLLFTQFDIPPGIAWLLILGGPALASFGAVWAFKLNKKNWKAQPILSSTACVLALLCAVGYVEWKLYIPPQKEPPPAPKEHPWIAEAKTRTTNPGPNSRKLSNQIPVGTSLQDVEYLLGIHKGEIVGEQPVDGYLRCIRIYDAGDGEVWTTFSMKDWRTVIEADAIGY